ncbi:hypothetical protein ASU25_03680 [Lactiplantibacillus plantarum]|nr:hypothetical protein ABT40_13215 [Lactiplantibacillus plantarum]KOE72294.1 hypothetical protein AB662_08725 [Lactiplantibacillus plantarum]KRU19835.1 hypothetical protein ASU25_03680 [Lactiplantibacillus plantarum]
MSSDAVTSLLDCDPVSITTAPQITPADALLVDLTPFSARVINKAIPVHLTLKSAYLDTGNHRKQLALTMIKTCHLVGLLFVSR